MKTIFADPFYFVALVSKRDEAHARVAAFEKGSERLVTTAWVLTEVANTLSARASRSGFVSVFAELRDDPDTVIVPPTQNLFERGVALYAERPDKDWSLTDCMSFVVMREMDISEALTGDRHFEQAGLTALLR